jgi:hypothetical protein
VVVVEKMFVVENGVFNSMCCSYGRVDVIDRASVGVGVGGYDGSVEV